MIEMIERPKTSYAGTLMAFGDWLKEERLKVKATQTELGDKMGRSKSYISQLESGINQSTGKPFKLHSELVFSIVDALNALGSLVTPGQAFREAGVQLSDDASAIVEEASDKPYDPLLRSLSDLGVQPFVDDMEFLGSVPAGPPERRYAEQLGGLVRALRADYVVRVVGNSMEPYYFDGDVLVVRKDQKPDPGDVVIALVYGDSVCKKLTTWRVDETTGETIYTLSPTNHQYLDIKSSDVTFQGVVVGKFTPAKKIT